MVAMRWRRHLLAGAAEAVGDAGRQQSFLSKCGMINGKSGFEAAVHSPPPKARKSAVVEDGRWYQTDPSRTTSDQAGFTLERAVWAGYLAVNWCS